MTHPIIHKDFASPDRAHEAESVKAAIDRVFEVLGPQLKFEFLKQLSERSLTPGQAVRGEFLKPGDVVAAASLGISLWEGVNGAIRFKVCAKVHDDPGVLKDLLK